MKKIIAFSSTHGTGKSSLAYMLAAKMKLSGHNVIVLDELARRCPFPINQNPDERTQIWLITKQIAEELELIDKVDYLIVDRGIMDSLCYDKVVSKSVDSAVMCDSLFSYLLQHIEKYYKIIYVPHKDSFNYQMDDGVRDLDIKFRDDVYHTMTTLYNRFSDVIPYKIIHKPEEVYADLGV